MEQFQIGTRLIGNKIRNGALATAIKPKRVQGEDSMAQEKISEKLVNECRTKLLQTKTDLLNRVKEAKLNFDNEDKGGDEADQTVRVLAEQEFLNMTDRLRHQLMEIESALARIENGTFGLCEETEEVIEPERLRAIPWTRLSIEGAEIRESMNKRFAR